jgi:hypothetical protein
LKIQGLATTGVQVPGDRPVYSVCIMREIHATKKTTNIKLLFKLVGSPRLRNLFLFHILAGKEALRWKQSS